MCVGGGGHCEQRSVGCVVIVARVWVGGRVSMQGRAPGREWSCVCTGVLEHLRRVCKHPCQMLGTDTSGENREEVYLRCVDEWWRSKWCVWPGVSG